MANEYYDEIDSNATNSPRSIRNIPASPTRPRVSRPGFESSSPRPLRTRRRGKSFLWLLVIIVLLALAALGALMFFQDSTVTVSPQTQTVSFDENMVYTAFAEGTSTSSAAALTYTVRSNTIEESVTMESTGTEEAEEVAAGIITIVNEYSAEPVRLIKNTRFETPDGLIYRIRNSVIVPGMKTVNGAVVPGTLEATVYADAAGAKYNIGPVAKFTLPGLKTSSPDMYAKVWARSTGSMSGGFVGERPTVSEQALVSARAKLRDTLTAKAASIEAEEGFLMLPELAEITFESLPIEDAGNGQIRIRERAVVQTPALSVEHFAARVASVASATADPASMKLTDTSTFTMRPVESASDETATLGEDPIAFTLSGTATFSGVVDTEQLAADLANKDRAAFETIVATYPGIESAAAALSPLWRKSFPENPEDITIVVEDKRQER